MSAKHTIEDELKHEKKSATALFERTQILEKEIDSLKGANKELLEACKKAIDVLAVEYSKGKGIVNADDALHAFGLLKEAIAKSEGKEGL